MTRSSLWDELVHRYSRGVEQVERMRTKWASLRKYVDDQRFTQVSQFLAIQKQEAHWWRDASIAYFQSVSKRPLQPGVTAPPMRSITTGR